MSQTIKQLVLLGGQIKTPPFSAKARRETGELLRSLQKGASLGMPRSRPMPSIGPRCHELRVRDEDRNWRIIYRTDHDAILVVDVFSKKTGKTPKRIIDVCQQCIKRYDDEQE
jgi:phage-related protein